MKTEEIVKELRRRGYEPHNALSSVYRELEHNTINKSEK